MPSSTASLLQLDPRCALCQIGGKLLQQACAHHALRAQIGPGEGIPVGERLNTVWRIVQWQRHRVLALARAGNQRRNAAFFEQREPFRPGKRIACLPCKVLQIVNRVVIADGRHWNCCLPRSEMPSTPARPSHCPLDHLALRGKDDAPALVLRGQTLSWKDLRSRVGSLAAWLIDMLPEPGARVASWAAKGELTCLMPLAAARAGLVHVPINPLLKRAQVKHILDDSGASLLIGNKARLASLEPDDCPDGCALMEDVAALASAMGLPKGLPPSDADPHDLAAILYTSGSTGRPKGVMLSHANLWLGAVSVAHYLKLAPDDVTLAVLPLSFDYGQSQLLSTWHAGGCVVPLDYLTPRDVIKACAKHGITTLAAVPPLWVQLVEQEWPAECDPLHAPSDQ